MTTWIPLVEWLSRFVLLGLLGLSVWSIATMIERRRVYKELNESDFEPKLQEWIEKKNKQQLLTWVNENTGLRADTLRRSLIKSPPALIDRNLSSYWQTKRLELEKGLSLLGTLGSITPFIGLLGTILGIIVSFGALSTGQIDSQKVMFSLAEALILTAVGLAVAIPSVVAFNYFSKQLTTLFQECEALKDACINLTNEDPNRL